MEDGSTGEPIGKEEVKVNHSLEPGCRGRANHGARRESEQRHLMSKMSTRSASRQAARLIFQSIKYYHGAVTSPDLMQRAVHEVCV